MYIVSPKPNYVYALDLNNNGVIKWEFRPDMNVEEATRQSRAAAPRPAASTTPRARSSTTRSTARCSASMPRPAKRCGARSAPTSSIGETTVGNMLVVGDLLIAGNAGGEYGVRGKVQAFDIDTGNLQWVMYNMGPDNEVGIGPRFNPFYADDKQRLARDLVRRQLASRRRHGVGLFHLGSGDRTTFYYSTGNCGPWNPDYRREWGVVNLDENGGLDRLPQQLVRLADGARRRPPAS